MPRKPKHPCGYPGCPALLTGFREDEIKDLFSVKMTPDDVGSNTEYDEEDFGDGEFAHECPRCGFRYN